MNIWIELYQYLFLNWWKCKLLNILSHYFLRLISIFKNWSIDHNIMKIQFTRKFTRNVQFFTIFSIQVFYFTNVISQIKKMKIKYDYLCHREESFQFFNFSIFLHKYLTSISVTNDSSKISTYHFSNYSQDSCAAERNLFRIRT